MTNLSGTSKQRIVLFVIPDDEGHRALIHILPPAGWSLDSAFDCVEAIMENPAQSIDTNAFPAEADRDLPVGRRASMGGSPEPWRLRCARTTVLRPRSITFHQLCLQPKAIDLRVRSAAPALA